MMDQNQSLHQHQFADLESIPDQIGYAILNAKDGTPLHSPSGSMSSHDIELLYQILLEVGGTMKGSGDKLNKINIEGGDILYSMCVTDDGYVYLVKRRAIDNGVH